MTLPKGPEPGGMNITFKVEGFINSITNTWVTQLTEMRKIELVLLSIYLYH